MQRELLRGHLEVLLLAVLLEGPAHGYALIQQLRSRSDGVLEVPEGSIYPALMRLERDELVFSSWSTASGRQRRVYRLTAVGRKAARERSESLRGFSRAVEAVLKGA